MITIVRDNEKVLIRFETDLPADCKGETTVYFPFEFRTREPSDAELVVRYFRARLENGIREARREAYERGYKDAKAKRAKQDWFNDSI